MIASFDPDGLIWVVVTLIRLLVALVRVGASAVGTIVILIVGCAIAYFTVAAVRQWLTGETSLRDLTDVTEAARPTSKDS